MIATAALAVTVAMLAGAPASHAMTPPVGSYNVVACGNRDRVVPNGSWVAGRGGQAGYSADAKCLDRGLLATLLGTAPLWPPDGKGMMLLANGARVPDGSHASLALSSPPGTTIVGLDAELYANATGSQREPARDPWEMAISAFNGGGAFLGGVWHCGNSRIKCHDHVAGHFVPPVDTRQLRIDLACYRGWGDRRCLPRRRGVAYQPAIDPSQYDGLPSLLATGTIVTIRDAQTPRVNALKIDEPATNGWHSGTITVREGASDNAGLQWFGARVDNVLFGPQLVSRTLTCPGRIGQGGDRNYRTVTPCPAASIGRSRFDTAQLSDGRHDIYVTAKDAAGNVNANAARAIGVLRVDNHAPVAPRDVAVSNGDGWRPTNDFTIHWGKPAEGRGSRIAKATLLLCPLGKTTGCSVQTKAQTDVWYMAHIRVPSQGQWAASVMLTDEAGNASWDEFSRPVVLRYDPTVPAKGTPKTPKGWVNAAGNVAIAQPTRQEAARGTSHMAGPSGFTDYRYTLDGSMPTKASPAARAANAATGAGAQIDTTHLPEGVNMVRVRTETGAHVLSPEAGEGELKLDKTRPTVRVTGLTDPGVWSSRPVTIRVTATDQRGLSGMTPAPMRDLPQTGAVVTIAVDGHPWVYRGARGQLTIRQAGVHRVWWQAKDAAGNHSAREYATVRVDLSGGPTVSASGQPDPAAWQPRPVAIRLAGAPRPGGSAVASVRYSLDGAGERAIAGARGVVIVGADGSHTLNYRAVSRAGSSSARKALSFRIDRTPPGVVAFAPRDLGDPRSLSVRVSDRTSGVAGGQIQMRRDGDDWSVLPTRFDGTHLLARVDDAHLRAGVYRFRAVARDRAGNVAVGEELADGRAFPSVNVDEAGAGFRLGTKVEAAVTTHRTRRVRTRVKRCHRARIRVMKRDRRHGHRWRWMHVRRCHRVWVTRRRPGFGRARKHRRVAHGKRIYVAAQATTASGAPLRHALVDVSTRIRATGASGYGLVKRVRTGSQGYFSYRLKAGPSRDIRVEVEPTGTLYPSRDLASVDVRAHSGIRADHRHVRAGATVRFRGRLKGGYVPTGGKLVAVQGWVPGKGWQTFANPIAGTDGRWHAKYRFAATYRTRTYKIRVLVPRDAAYPWLRWASKPVRVRVRA